VENKNTILDDLVAKAKREYGKKWRERNPEKVRQYANSFWCKKALQLKAELEQSVPVIDKGVDNE